MLLGFEMSNKLRQLLLLFSLLLAGPIDFYQAESNTYCNLQDSSCTYRVVVNFLRLRILLVQIDPAILFYQFNDFPAAIGHFYYHKFLK